MPCWWANLWFSFLWSEANATHLSQFSISSIISWKIPALFQYGFSKDSCPASVQPASSLHGFLSKVLRDALSFVFCFNSSGLAAVHGVANPPPTTIGFLGTKRNLFQPHSRSSKAGQIVLQMVPHFNFFLLFRCLGSLSILKHLKGDLPFSQNHNYSWFYFILFFAKHKLCCWNHGAWTFSH